MLIRERRGPGWLARVAKWLSAILPFINGSADLRVLTTAPQTRSLVLTSRASEI
jgi:hypothetical protein